MDNQDKVAEYIFTVNPGLGVTNAYMTDDKITIDDSIFSKSQIIVLEKIVNNEIKKLTDEHEKILENAIKENYEKGLKEGVHKTTEKLSDDVSATIDNLKTLMDNLRFNANEFLEFHENEILKLITNIARKVIDVEVLLNQEIVLSTLKRSLQYLNEKEEIRILVNPNDWGIVKENINKLHLNIDMPKNIEIVAVENIQAGGCRIDFKAGSIDADIETQFAEIKRNLFKNDV